LVLVFFPDLLGKALAELRFAVSREHGEFVKLVGGLKCRISLRSLGSGVLSVL
jgi:hypothetical protein